MNRYRSGCSRLVLALLLVGLWPQAARGWVDQIVFEESRRAMMLATGLIVTGTGLAVTTRGLGPPETAFDGRLKQLPSMRVGPLVELRLRDGSGLAGIVLAWIEQDDSLYIRSLSDLALGGRHRPNRSGCSGIFLNRPPGYPAKIPKNRPRFGRESHPRPKPDRLPELDPRPWLVADPPACERLRLVVDGEPVEIGLERIEFLRCPMTGTVSKVGVAITAVGIGMISASLKN